MEQYLLYMLGAVIFISTITSVHRIFKEELDISCHIWKSVKLIHIVSAFITLSTAIIVTIVLSGTHEFFKLSLTSFILGGKSFNILFAPMSAMQGTGNPILVKIFGIVFVVLLVIMMPILNMNEEYYFRKGKNLLKDIPIQSFYFGSVHFFAGISIATCIGLMFVGAIWHIAYKIRYDALVKKGIPNNVAELNATIWSISFHNAHNNLCLLVLAGFLIFGGLVSQKKIQEARYYAGFLFIMTDYYL